MTAYEELTLQLGLLTTLVYLCICSFGIYKKYYY